jgi:serine/threonine-protein kinase
MGEVFHGTIRESGAPVAVKVLKAELMADGEVVSRFVQERSILTSISHPNVVRVIDLVVEGDTLGIVMELVRGRDLRRALAEAQTQAAGGLDGGARRRRAPPGHQAGEHTPGLLR